MIHFLRTLFRPAPVVVNTYKTKRTDLEKERIKTHLKLATEMGKPDPLRIPDFEFEAVKFGEAA